ncbi:MAG: AMIN domain-containing protein, partial [Deltaproteobacteria bacterium]
MLGIASRLRYRGGLLAVCLGLSAGLGLAPKCHAAAQAALAPADTPLKLSAIGGVEVQKDGSGRSLRIKTAGAPTFTVFRLNDPMRVVIDISGGDVSAIHGPLVYEDGVIDQVALRQYEADGFAMGRVIVGFDHPCRYDVQTEGNDVVLRADGADIEPGETAHVVAAQPGTAASKVAGVPHGTPVSAEAPADAGLKEASRTASAAAHAPASQAVA